MAESVAERRGTAVRLARPRLIDRLDHDRRLTVVTGPPGSGKSVLLDQWRPAGHVIRIAVDERHRDPVRLWRPVLSSIHCGLSTGDLPDADPAAVADGLDGLAGPVVLVLDGLDRLGPGPAVDSVAALLGFGLPGVRLVVAARAAVGLPVPRLRLAGELVEIGPADLAFTASEARELCARYGHPLSEVEAEALADRTEGWAAAVALTALDPGEAGEEVAAFVRSEILAAIPVGLLEFLMRVSLADPVRPDLIRVLSGESAHWLDEARQGGYLRPAGGGAYRCPRPIRDALRGEAEHRLAADLPALHRRAADWYAGHGPAAAALHHAGRSRDWDHAAALVVRLGAALLLDDRPALIDLTARLPIVDALEDPVRATALAVGAAARGDGPGSEAYAALVRPRLPGLPPSRRTPLAALLALCALVTARDDEDGPALATHAAALLDELAAAVPGLVPEAEALGAVALMGLGLARMWAGEVDDARYRLTLAVGAAERAGRPELASDARAGLALLHCGQGRLREALAEAEAAGPASRLAAAARAYATLLTADPTGPSGNAGAFGLVPVPGPDAASGRPSEAVLAALWARGRVDSDRAAARTVLTGLSTVDLPRLARDWLALAEAELHLAEGRPVHALTVLGDLRLGRDAPLGGPARVMTARAYLASAAPARALSLLAPLAGWTGLGPAVRVEARIVEALAADALGHDGAVAIALTDAVARAAADGIVAPFAQARGLLARYRDLFDVGRLTLDAPPTPPLVEPLTTRELVVLRYLPTLLTLTDIARELSVSPNTVKTHLRHVYRKLGVGTRRAAVHQARLRALLR